MSKKKRVRIIFIFHRREAQDGADVDSVVSEAPSWLGPSAFLYFLVVMLTLSMSVLSIAESLEGPPREDPDAVRSAVAADVLRDVPKDVNQRTWCFRGGCLGVLGLAAGGGLAALAKQAKLVSNDMQRLYIAGIFAPIVALPLARYWAYKSPAGPPPERLLGKSPAYIDAYTQAYKSKVRSHRFQCALFAVLAVDGAVAAFVSYFLENPPQLF